MNYSLRNIFFQEPEQVKGAVLVVLAALVLTGVINLSGEATAAWGIVIERVLGLFYVRPLTASKDALQQWDDAVAKPKRVAAKK